MPTAFVHGDLFAAAGLDALAHGCNCAGAMGKGIAVEFRRRYPAMYTAYQDRCARRAFQLGDVFMWREAALTIYNLGTQRTWRSGADLEAIERSLREMIRLAADAGVRRIGLPRIGAGLGGLPWPDIRAVLEHVGASTAVELVVFETYAPAAGAPA